MANDDIINDNTDIEEVGGESVESRFQKCEKEREEYLDGWRRAKADFVNYKKGEEERLLRIGQFGQEVLMRDLMAVLDSFGLGLLSWKEEGSEKKGMTLVKIQLEDVLKKYGVEPVHAKRGDHFLPGEHECVQLENSEEEDGLVTEEISPGYKLHGKVIRPVRVKVTKKNN